MRKSAILATLAVLALAGCGNGSTDEASADQIAADDQSAAAEDVFHEQVAAEETEEIIFAKGDYRPGYEFNPSQCSSSENQFCANKTDWKVLCENVSHFRNTVISSYIGRGYASAAQTHLARNGGLNWSTSWVQHPHNNGMDPHICQLNLRFSGIYEGSQINQTENLRVTVISVDENTIISDADVTL
jgi:hypothetical protein